MQKNSLLRKYFGNWVGKGLGDILFYTKAFFNFYKNIRVVISLFHEIADSLPRSEKAGSNYHA